MTRRFTVPIFLIIMTFFVVMKGSVFGYCSCVENFFVGGCACSEQSTDCCQHDSCGDEAPAPSPQTPCDDCTDELAIDIADFVAPATESLPDAAVVALPAYWSPAPTVPLMPICHGSRYPSGAAPPPRYCGAPIFLRHASLRM